MTMNRSVTTLLAAIAVAISVFRPGWPAEYQGAQRAYDTLKSPLSARVTDRTFRTKEAMYLANELQWLGLRFPSDLLAAGIDLSDDLDFMYLTNTEAYWYSRYNMSALTTESRLGLVLVHGPYIALKAIEEGPVLDNRDRGENVQADREVLLRNIVPHFMRRTGFPRRFEDASPLMIEFESGDPHYPRAIDKGRDFKAPQHAWIERELKRLYGDAYKFPLEKGNSMWKYRVNYRDNFLTLRWDHDKMSHVIDMGGTGQTFMKRIIWIEYFMQANHHTKYLGNNPEEGFRGAMLTLMSVSNMMLVKSALFSDGRHLLGINPLTYDPAKGIRYFPHRIGARLRYVGDLPPRPEEFHVVDSSSQLFDLASYLWGAAEYAHLSDPRGSYKHLFGSDTPYDGSIMERKYTVLARGLADVCVKNIEAMHRHGGSGHLVSVWEPGKQGGTTVTVRDLGMTLMALANYHRHIPEKAEPVLHPRVAALMKSEADFLVEKLQGQDGAFREGYDHAKGEAGGAKTLEAQGFAIRGLLEAARELGDSRYAEAAKRAYRYMVSTLWHEKTGLFRSSEGATVTVYTPMNLGAALGAMREIILLTKDRKEIERLKRFFVQGVNRSGIQQSEYEETGPLDFNAPDDDGDGIPRMEFAGGKHGIAPVFASRVEIDTP